MLLRSSTSHQNEYREDHSILDISANFTFSKRFRMAMTSDTGHFRNQYYAVFVGELAFTKYDVARSLTVITVCSGDICIFKWTADFVADSCSTVAKIGPDTARVWPSITARSDMAGIVGVHWGNGGRFGTSSTHEFCRMQTYDDVSPDSIGRK